MDWKKSRSLINPLEVNIIALRKRLLALNYEKQSYSKQYLLATIKFNEPMETSPKLYGRCLFNQNNFPMKNPSDAFQKSFYSSVFCMAFSCRHFPDKS